MLYTTLNATVRMVDTKIENLILSDLVNCTVFVSAFVITVSFIIFNYTTIYESDLLSPFPPN